MIKFRNTQVSHARCLCILHCMLVDYASSTYDFMMHSTPASTWVETVQKALIRWAAFIFLLVLYSGRSLEAPLASKISVPSSSSCPDRTPLPSPPATSASCGCLCLKIDGRPGNRCLFTAAACRHSSHSFDIQPSLSCFSMDLRSDRTCLCLQIKQYCWKFHKLYWFRKVDMLLAVSWFSLLNLSVW